MSLLRKFVKYLFIKIYKIEPDSCSEHLFTDCNGMAVRSLSNSKKQACCPHIWWFK